jgi:hypothetical protein
MHNWAEFWCFFDYPLSNIRAITGVHRMLIYTNACDPEETLHFLMRDGMKDWKSLRVLTVVDDSDQIKFLENLKEWLKGQIHTKNWVYFTPKHRHHRRHGKRVLEWKHKISQWMAPRDPLFRDFRFRVRFTDRDEY